MPGRPPSASTSIPESSASASIDVPAAAARAFSKAFSAYEAAPARGSVSDGKSVRSRTRYGMPPSRALSSRALARLAVARTSVRSEQEGLFATRLEGAALEPDQPIDAGGRHTIADDRARRAAGLHQGADGVGHRDEGARDGGGPRAPVRLDHVAVHPDAPLAELRHLDHRAQRAPDEALDLLGAPARPGTLAGRARIGGARQHAVLGRHPALALPLEEGRNLVLDRGGAEDFGVAELHEHRALGIAQVVTGDRNGAELIRAAAIVSLHGQTQRGRSALAGSVCAVRTRWSWRRLYSASPVAIARATASRYSDVASLRSSLRLVRKPISMRMAGMVAPPRT